MTIHCGQLKLPGNVLTWELARSWSSTRSLTHLSLIQYILTY